MPHRSVRLPLFAAMPALLALLVSAAPAFAGNSPTPVDDDFFQPTTADFGGADPLATDRTVQHWAGQTDNPADGVTYRYNMVGTDPAGNDAATIPVDIIPIDLNVGGVGFSGSDSVAGVVNSPLFNSFDYSSAWFATKQFPVLDSTGAVVDWQCCVVWRRMGPTGPIKFPISAGNTGQLIDATMRAQFNKVGSSYHLYLGQPTVYDTQSINVPNGRGMVAVNPIGMRFGVVSVSWMQTRIQNLMGSLHLDPTHLAIFLTTDVVLFKGNDPSTGCCVFGGHGAGHATGSGDGAVNGNGDQPLQTFVWSSWLTAGISGPKAWINKDINGLSHELTEWASDPFNNNTVQPWASRNGASYGCVAELETGDPTINAGFTVGNPGSNHYNHNPFPPFDDGMFHVQDEALLPWFMRLPADNTFSQVTQSGTGGRYTLMGDVSIAEFHSPAQSC